MQTAKLFKNGQSQAVRLPKEFRFEGEKVYLKKIGNAVVLLPEKNSWKPLFESLDEFSEDFDKNKEVLKKYTIIASPKLRNVIAGYVSRLIKQSKEGKVKKSMNKEDLSKFY